MQAKFNRALIAAARGLLLRALTCAALASALAWVSSAAGEPGRIAPASRFGDLRAAIFSDPYRELPHYPVSRRLFGPGGEDPSNALRAAARRTLSSDADLVEFAAGQKLFQPNGICFAGQWRIDAESPYSGVFAAAALSPAIVRISVMLGEVERGARRTLGMAVKLFPKQAEGPDGSSVNILVMDRIAGSRRAHVSAAVLDNAPDFGGLPPFGQIGTALRIRRDLNAVDGELSAAGPQLRYRSLVHAAGREQRAPHWIRFTIAPGTPRVDAADFRDELALRHYPDARLVYLIEVADWSARGKTAALWQPLGRLELESDVVSASCDRRLHFAHPRLGAPRGRGR